MWRAEGRELMRQRAAGAGLAGVPGRAMSWCGSNARSSIRGHCSYVFMLVVAAFVLEPIELFFYATENSSVVWSWRLCLLVRAVRPAKSGQSGKKRPPKRKENLPPVEFVPGFT